MDSTEKRELSDCSDAGDTGMTTISKLSSSDAEGGELSRLTCSMAVARGSTGSVGGETMEKSVETSEDDGVVDRLLMLMSVRGMVG